MTLTETKSLIAKFRQSSNKLILLDYDGTLVNFEPEPEKAIPTLHLIKVLKKLIAYPQTKIIVISGRSQADMDKFLGLLPIDFIAEHGAMTKDNGIWSKHYSDDVIWKDKIIPIITKFISECPHSFLEEKQFSLVWHYRNVDTVIGYNCSRELLKILKETLAPFNLKLLDGNKVIEIMTKGVGKGNAVKNLLEHANFDYILSIGDDKTDEDMFEFLLPYENADTIKVGKGDTFAKFKLDNVEEVFKFLEQL